MRQVQLY